MSDWEVIHGDCLEVMAGMDADSVDAIVTDPPYGLAFMGKQWDHGVPGEPFWREALRVAKPGAHILAFGGTRTYHRLACGIEDAGWEIRDCLSWLYGSGFPKSHNGPWGGTALKPAWEPIIMARKPLIGTVAANVEAHGTGGLNIDGCRLGSGPTQTNHTAKVGNAPGWSGRATGEVTQHCGRWPANVCLDPEAAAILDAQSGALSSGAPPKRRGANRDGTLYGEYGAMQGCQQPRGASIGGASRFFYVAKAARSEREAGLEGVAVRVAGAMQGNTGTIPSRMAGDGVTPVRQVRAANHHPTVKPIDLMRWLCRMVTPRGGTVLDPFMGSGTTGCAAVLEGFDFRGVDLDSEYVRIARKRVAHWGSQTALDLEAA